MEKTRETRKINRSVVQEACRTVSVDTGLSVYAIFENKHIRFVVQERGENSRQRVYDLQNEIMTSSANQYAKTIRFLKKRLEFMPVEPLPENGDSPDLENISS